MVPAKKTQAKRRARTTYVPVGIEIHARKIKGNSATFRLFNLDKGEYTSEEMNESRVRKMLLNTALNLIMRDFVGPMEGHKGDITALIQMSFGLIDPDEGKALILALKEALEINDGTIRKTLSLGTSGVKAFRKVTDPWLSKPKE